jgi:5-dehydro-4-deoxyglucarate dehydratase
MTYTRRSLLLGGAIATIARSEAGDKPRYSPQEFKARLVGPILSNPTPFTSRFELDHQGLRRIIARALHYGVPVFESTAGNSQYSSRSYDEIKQITRTMVEGVDGKGLTIVATDGWWTSRVIDFCQFAESIGSDAVQILMPSRANGEDSIFEHFRAVARSTKLPIVLHGVYSESLLRKIMTIDSVVAMKEDSELTYYIDREIEFGERFSIFSGGAENRYLVGYPYGARAFFSTYTTFAPDISMRFWKAMQANDLAKATAITQKYDYPFIKNFTHPFWHATLEYFGLAQRYLRPPQKSFSGEEMKSVKDFFDAQGVYPKDYA